MIDKNAEFMFMFQNDSIMTLTNPTLEMPAVSRSTGGSMYTGHVTIPISPEQLKVFQTALLKKIRFYTSIGYIEKKVRTGIWVKNLALLIKNAK